MRFIFTVLRQGSVLYGLSLVLQKLLNIVLLPVYTRFLPPDAYGTFALLNTCGQAILPLLMLGLSQALVWAVVYRNFNETQTTGSTLAFQFSYGAALTLVLLALAPWLTEALFGDRTHTVLMRLVFIAFYLETMEYLLMTHCRIRERMGTMAAIASGRFTTSALLHVIFLAGLHMGVQGLVIAQLITAFLFGGGALLYLWKQQPPQWSMPDIGILIRHGWPMVPAQVSAMILTVSDRFFLQHFRDAHEVGWYALGYNIGMVINIVIISIQVVWQKQMFDLVRDNPEAKQVMSQLVTRYVAGVGFAGLGLALFSHEVIVLLTPSDYHAASRVVPLVVSAYVLNGITHFTNIGMKIRNRNHLSTPIVVAAAILNLGLNLVLIPAYGMMGAAWATALAYGVQATAYVVVNQWLWKVPFAYRRLLALAALLLTAFGVGRLLMTEHFWLNVALKFAVLALVALLVWSAYRAHTKSAARCR